ncbi:MAG: hypothetical protein RIG62_31600 [Cyclobacteriaceae bacterium]
MSTTLQHHALLLAPQCNQRGVLRNRAAGNITFHNGPQTYQVVIPFYSGSSGVNAMEKKIRAAVEQQYQIKLAAPRGSITLGTGGQNVHTEAGLAIIAKRLISRNSGLLTRIDLRIFTEKEPCKDCLAELRVVNRSLSIGGGSITLHTQDEHQHASPVALPPI